MRISDWSSDVCSSDLVVSNLQMREAIDEAAIKVREGASLSRSLAASKLFPPITVHLIASGESSGRLDEMLDRSAENQEREVEMLVQTTVSIFEPALIVGMGGIVLLIVLAILVPIFRSEEHTSELQSLML